MSGLGLRPTGRLGLSPRHRRTSSPPLLTDQLADLAYWPGADGLSNTLCIGTVQDAFGRSGNGRHGTAVDIVKTAPAVRQQLKLTDWAAPDRASHE